MLSNVINSDRPSILLASSDPAFVLHMRRIFDSLALRFQDVADGDEAIEAMGALEEPGVILLDVRISGVAIGRLLAMIHESGIRRRCAVALVAEKTSEESLALLRKGMIDAIVPLDADAAAWGTHLSTMQRGHALYCELEHLRETASIDLEHDRVTGTLNRAAMLSVLFRETDRVQRLRGVLCLVMFDLDDFAHSNSQLGPNACEQLLREIAKRTTHMLRTYDLLGRLGKDQFLMALPGCSTVNAVLMVERLRMEVFGEPFLVNDDRGEVVPVGLTACFAIASSCGRSPVVVLREAEQRWREPKFTAPIRIVARAIRPCLPGIC